MTDRKSHLTRTDVRLTFFGHIARADPSMDPAWAAGEVKKEEARRASAEGAMIEAPKASGERRRRRVGWSWV